MKNTKK